MFLIILLFVLSVLFTFLAIKAENKWVDLVTPCMTFGLCAIALCCGFLISVGAVFCLKSENKTFIEQYEYLSGVVECGNVDTPVVEEVIAANKKIAEHRVNADSKWVGVYYSKEVAELPYLVLPVAENDPE